MRLPSYAYIAARNLTPLKVTRSIAKNLARFLHGGLPIQVEPLRTKLQSARKMPRFHIARFTQGSVFVAVKRMS